MQRYDVVVIGGGAAGGSALVTTVEDLARFWDALLDSRLFRHSKTLREMLTFGPTPGDVTSGYGLGVEQYTMPDGTELIGTSAVRGPTAHSSAACAPRASRSRSRCTSMTTLRLSSSRSWKRSRERLGESEHLC